MPLDGLHLPLLDECPTGTCHRFECRHHLPGEGHESCVLDLTSEPRTLDFIARVFDVTRERIRQIEAVALKKCRDAGVDFEQPNTRVESYWERLEINAPGCVGTTKAWKWRTTKR